MARRLQELARRSATWTNRVDLVLLATLLLLVLSAWFFVELADEVREGSTQEIDEWILLALRNAHDLADPIGPLWLEEAIRDVTALGSPAVLGLMTAFVTGYLLIARKRHAAALVIVSTAGGLLLTWILKELFARPRPAVVPMLTPPVLASFPSGHAQLASVVYVTLGALLAGLTQERKAKAYILGTALFLAFLVGASRVYLGMHYPTDVLAGWAAGLAWALLCWIAADQLKRRHMVETLGRES